jgi:hypothetical protein
MRNISAASLAQINKQYGIESIVVIRIIWGDGRYNDYGEKDHPDYNVDGRIMSTGGIDDIVSITGSGNSKSVEVVLSDHDGALKNVFDSTDLHKVRCQVLQWFDGIPLSEAFVIFDGVINTPITWREGDRTLSITVMSLLENLEFGFSPDESYFDLVPHNMMGEAWPVVFGTNLRLRALQINQSPEILLAQGFSIVDHHQWEADLQNLDLQADAAYDQAKAAYAASIAASLVASGYDDGLEGGIGNSPPDDYNTFRQYFDQSQQYYQQFNQYMEEYKKIKLERQDQERLYDKQKDLERRQVFVISPNAPRGVPLIVEMGGTRWTVRIDGVVMSLIKELTPKDVRTTAFALFDENTTRTQWQGQPTREKFRWVNGGTRLKVLDYPIRYIVSLGHDQILNLMGRQQGMYIKIPPQYYSIQYLPLVRRDGITVNATAVTFFRPLTSILNRYGDQIWESDDVYVDVVGTAPGKMVDILVYAITNFSNLTYDPGSFGVARLYTDQVPMNHVVRDRVDTLKYIEDIAFQGKCALWVKDGVVYIRYLPVEPSPVDTISTSDILEDSLEISSTSTEEVVTKLSALWKFTEDQPESNRIIYRYNIQKYGLHEMEYSFFAFNDPASVGWSARYWIMRKSSVFKRIKFRTDLTKLNLESFDAITIDMPGLVANTSVVGLVESAVYNSDQKEIEFTVWLPVRLGEMNKFNFAYPGTDFPLFGNPADPGIYTGNPYEHVQDASGYTQPGPNAYILGRLGYYPPMRPTAYNPEVFDPSAEVSVDTFIMALPVDSTLPEGIETFNDYNRYQVKEAEPLTIEPDATGNASFGTIVEQSSNNEYKVKLLLSNNVVKVTQLLIAGESPPIPPETPVIVLKIKGSYYMQTPIWLS